MIKTSRSENIPFRMMNIFKMRSVYVSFGSFFVGAILSIILKSNEIINGPAAAVLFLASGIVSFLFCEYLYDGKYPLENCEKLLSNIKYSPHKFCLENVKEANVEIREINPHKKSEEYDFKSWYLPTGEEVIGIKIIEIGYNSIINANSLFSESRFESFCSSLLQILPLNSVVKYVCPNSLDLEIPKHLASKKIMKGDYYIFIRLSRNLESEGKKEEILKLINGNFIRMTHKEMAEATEKIFFPFNIPSFDVVPKFKSGFSFEKGFIKGTWVGIESAVITLVQLPIEVDEDFQRIYSCLSDITSTISITIQAVKSDGSVSKYLKEKIKIKVGTTTENQDAQKTQENDISCFMQLSILIHGKYDQIAQKISEIEALCVSLGQNKRPMFGQDIAFPADAFKSFLPASEPRIPFRKQIITQINEIICYIPRPKFSKKMKDTKIIPDLNLRTMDNRIFQLKLDPQFPIIYVSPPGSGKSLNLSISILSQIRKKMNGGVGGCYIEIGMSFKFLCQKGLADAWLTLVKEEEFQPLEDHPFSALFAFESYGVGLATEWICELCGIDFDAESAVAAEVREIILNCYNENIYSLQTFFEIFENKFSNRCEADKKWLDRIQNLRNFVDPNVYGKVFVPKEPKNFDWKNARFIYFSTSSTRVTQPKKLYGAYFSLAITLCDLLSEKHTSKRKVPLEIQFIVDEVHAARECIPQKKIRLLNSQSRKDGMRVEFATQELTDFVIDDEDNEKKFGIITTTRRLFFKENPGELISYMFRTKEESKEIMKKINYIAKRNIELLSEGKYAWGYIDENKVVHQVLLDVDKVDLWAITTHAGSIAIRQACLRTGLYDYWETCELLAKYGPVNLPQYIPPENEIQKIVNEVIRSPKREL